jgi:c-di-GMP-binding flagellar brake protein YcgR
MSQSYEEKRSSPRTFFDSLEKVAATINGSKDSFSVDVLNLSVGGLQFSQERGGAVAVKPGDQLSLVDVQGVAGLQIVSGVTMEVRWIMDHSFLGVISAGCQFIDLPEEYQQQIEQVVEARCQK